MIATIKNLFPTKKNPKSQILETLPIKEISNYIQLKDGLYRAVAQVTPINTENLNEEGIDEVVEQLQELLNSEPGMMQIKVSSEPMDMEDYMDYIDQQSDQASNAYFLERIHSYKDYVNKRMENSRNQKKFYIILKCPYTDAQMIKEDMENKLSVINEKLMANDMRCKFVGEDGIKELLYKKMNPNTSEAQPYDPSMNFYDILPAYINYNQVNVEVDGMYYRQFAIVHYPQGKNKAGWFKQILGYNGNVELDIYLRPADPIEIEKHISNSIGQIETRLEEKLPTV